MKIYLDTNIFSKILDDSILEEQLLALDKLSDIATIELVTSPKTREEFLNCTKDRTKFKLKVLYKLINKIPDAETTITLGGFGTATFGMTPFGAGVVEEDELFSRLKEIFEADDAEHIFQAIKGGASHFLTMDYKTIINRTTPEIEKEYNMHFVDPVKLADKLLSQVD